MPLVEGVGNEVLVVALLAGPPVCWVFRATYRPSLAGLRRGVAALRNGLRRLWRHLRPPGSQHASPTATSVGPVSPPRSLLLQSEAPEAGETCCVCHDAFALPCQANCSHWFCGDCILRVWRHGQARGVQPCRCPICRRTITLLLPSSGAAAQQEQLEQQQRAGEPGQEQLRALAESVRRGVEEYNRRFGGGPVSLWQRLQDMPMLLQRMAMELRDPRRAMRLLNNARVFCCITGMVLYLISPLDILSEGLFGVLGLLDDLVFILIAGYYLSIVYRSIVIHARAIPGVG